VEVVPDLEAQREAEPARLAWAAQPSVAVRQREELAVGLPRAR
jgi:hypothetical protein